MSHNLSSQFTNISNNIDELRDSVIYLLQQGFVINYKVCVLEIECFRSIGVNLKQ